MSRQRTIVRVKKPKVARGGSSEDTSDPTSVFGDGAGAKFSAAAKNLVGSAFDPSAFLNDSIYGNLKTTHPKYLLAKRECVSAAFDKIVRSVAWLLRDGVAKRNQEQPSYKQARTKAAILADWRQLIVKHPHAWPSSPMFTYIMQLRDLMISVDKATHNSLSLNMQERFNEWSETEKVLLPSDPPYCFLGLDLSAAYAYIKTLFEQSGIVVAEFCTPPYGWRIAIVNNTHKLLTATSFAPPGFADIIKQWAQKEIYKQYLSKLGIIEHTLDFAKLLPSLAQEASMETAKSLMEGLLSRQKEASMVFGSEAVKDMGDLLGELKSKEKAFSPSEEETSCLEKESPIPTAESLLQTVGPAAATAKGLAGLAMAAAAAEDAADPTAEAAAAEEAAAEEADRCDEESSGPRVDFVGDCDDAL